LPSEPNWLPIEAVIEHNRLELADTGENHFLRDRGLLESALARPRNAFAYGEEDVVVLAVSLMAGIARAHAFEQGNKRTAFAAMQLFLRINGYDTTFDDSVSWADEIISLIEHRSTEEDFVRAIRPFVVPRPA
jgi:death-on-curing protein